ncbi:short-chain dehydrogenase [Streptomyces sp. NPDC046862]|uniref:short-chain dehydrogenase n=1 Tax=Streptomyces sp. NPDC046862 TaxID=3154603 RepID=UPI0034566AE5
MSQDVAVVIGVGGMGQAIARRIGPGTHLLLGDFNEETLDAVTRQLCDEGYEVTSAVVDVASRESVHALAGRADSLGPVRRLLEEFGALVAPGGAAVVIASLAAHGYPPIQGSEAPQLSTAPAGELLSLPITAPENFPASTHAHGFAKQANLLRVQAASTPRGARGARVNTVSSGIIATPADIAVATDFLLSPGAGFISGTDLPVDGGVTAALRSGRLEHLGLA